MPIYVSLNDESINLRNASPVPGMDPNDKQEGKKGKTKTKQTVKHQTLWSFLANTKDKVPREQDPMEFLTTLTHLLLTDLIKFDVLARDTVVLPVFGCSTRTSRTCDICKDGMSRVY